MWVSMLWFSWLVLSGCVQDYFLFMKSGGRSFLWMFILVGLMLLILGYRIVVVSSSRNMIMLMWNLVEVSVSC